MQVRLALVESSWAIGAGGGAGAGAGGGSGAGSGAGAGTKDETADNSSISNSDVALGAAASAAAHVPSAAAAPVPVAVAHAASTSHDTLPPLGLPQHTYFASPTGAATNEQHHCCSMLDTKSPVFLALADALSAHVANRLTPVLDAGLSNSLHVMYQVSKLSSVADHHARY